MKQLTKAISYKNVVILLLLSFLQTIAWAQDSTSSSVTKSSSRITTTETTWYGEPWVWVVGVAVLIIIIVALTRGNSGSSGGTVDRVSYTKKVTREDNT